MALSDLLKGGRLRLMPRMRRASPRQARQAAKIVPVIGCIPGSEVWFFRFAIAFLAHLGQGGQIVDRLRGRVVGSAAGRPFNFDHLTGGPLLWAPNLVASDHLFIGHAVCPGFNKVAAGFPWWQDTRFCAPGFDYFHEGLDYTQVPVDMAPHTTVPVSVKGLDGAAWAEPGQRAVLVYPDPLDQAACYFNYCRKHFAPAYNTLDGRPLADWNFRDYLFLHALPSYAKVFVSYQVMASQVPGSVSIVPHWRLLERPAETLASMLSHLTGRSQDWPMIEDAVDLARREHLAAVELELGRPLDGTRRRRPSRNRDVREEIFHEELDPDLGREALELLASLGVDSQYFAAPSGTATSSRLSVA
jgi:hypothetical protein